MSRLALRSIRTSLVALALCAGALGCTQWEELPEGAIAFLDIRRAELHGTLHGVEVSGRVDRATGYCTLSGWMVELSGRSVDGADGVAMTAVDVRELFWGSDDAMVAVFQGQQPDGRMVLSAESSSVEDSWSGEEATAVVEGCSGPTDGAWQQEEYAEIAILEIERPTWNEMRVTFEAQFPSGDVLQGQFDAEMPANE